ncbi:MAG: AraC family transcriptional regulator [Planctomycetaceae bacterium]|nr:AraC family transcriptional regulator [Planctomycetaceae bacterium]
MKSRTIKRPAEMPPELRAINARLLQTLFNLTPDVAFFVKDSAGRYVIVNESLLARHGLKYESDAIGKRPQEICPGDFGRLPTEQDQRVLRTGKAIIEHLELQWRRPAEPVWCLTSKFPIHDAAGNVIGIIGFSRDVRDALRTDEIPQSFAQAMAEFEQNPAGDYSTTRFAERSQLSQSRLARLTKRVFGLTPSQFVVKTRITVGAQLLRDTERSISAIAQSCGYQDQSAFTRAFRATTQLTPLEYRRRERNARKSANLA